MRKYRRHGVGRQAALELFNRFRGRWEIGQIPQNPAAVEFWRRVIGEYTGGRFEVVTRDDAGWRGAIQIFDSAPG